jgi:hypothetical protein
VLVIRPEHNIDPLRGQPVIILQNGIGRGDHAEKGDGQLTHFIIVPRIPISTPMS